MSMRIAERSALRKIVPAFLLGCISLIALDAIIGRPAQAQSATKAVTYNIPAGSLGTALTRWAQASGLKLLAPSGVLNGRTSSGLSGTYEPYQALDALLANSGLTHTTAGNTVTVTDPSASGNNVGASVEGAIALDTIDVSGGSAAQAAADAPYQTPGSSAYVSAEQIQRIPPTSVGDMFKSTPGVISAGNRNGQSIDVNIRGLQGANRVNMLVDGTQQTTSSYRGYGGHDNRVYVDPELIGGIAIEKGPTGGPHGAGFIGGVVNMRTLEAVDIVKDGANVGLRLNGSIGSNTVDPPALGAMATRFGGSDTLSFDNGIGSIAGAATTENAEIVVAAARRRSGNYFAGKHGSTTTTISGLTTPISAYKPGEEVFNTSFDTRSELIKGKVRFMDDHTLELGYIHYDSSYGEAWPDLTRFNIKQEVWLANTGVSTYTSRYTYAPSDNPLIQLHANAWATDTKTDLPPLYTTSDVFTSGAELWNLSRATTAFGELQLKYGSSYAREDGGSIERLNGASFDGIRSIASVFNDVTLDVTSWLQLGATVRYDRYEIDGVGDTNLYGPTGEKFFGSEGERISPTASVTLTPWDGVQVFGQYANGWRPPTLREVVGISGMVAPNPNLEPETAQNFEFGVNLIRDGLITESDTVRAKIAYFDNTYANYITRQYAHLHGIPGVSYTWANIPEARFKGLEGQLSYDTGDYFADASFTYYTDATYCFNDTGGPATCRNTTPGTDYGSSVVPPKYAGSVTLGGRFFDRTLTLGTRVSFAGERAADATLSAVTLPYVWAPYAVVDVFASYKYTEESTFNLSVDNLGDRYYVDALGNAYMPAPGRLIRSGMTLKF